MISWIKNAIGANDIPKYLYKYYKINDYSLRVLKQNEVYFSKPSAFNDPFDCRNQYRFNTRSRAFVKYMKRIHLEIHHTPRDPQVMQEFDAMIDDYKSGRRTLPEGYERELADKSADIIGVLCLTSVNNNILMWSHYADCHKGFAVKINMDNLIESLFAQGGVKNGLSCEQVIYRRKYPYIEYFSSTEKDRMKKVVQYKSADWKYEKEWRIVVGDYGDKSFISRAQFVDTVYLGCQMSDQDKAVITGASQKINIPVYQMEKMQYRYGLTKRAV